MKLVWWKVYFWLNVALLAFVVYAEFSNTTAPVGLFLADVALYTISLAGVFSYFSKKPIFDARFWKYFFWFNIVYTGAYMLYAIAPTAPYISSLSFLAYGEQEDLLFTALIGLVLSLPILYATFQLSKGIYFQEKTKEQELREAAVFRWGIVQTALWGYSIVFLTILLLLSLVSSEQTSSSAGAGEADIIYSLLIFSPIFIFWVWVAAQYKKYTWNWWRITLLLNSVLFSGIVVFGTFFYEPVASSASESSEFDIIGLLQFSIILAGLVVFGREQFAKFDKAPKVEVTSSKKQKE
jgi:hypothetical protein